MPTEKKQGLIEALEEVLDLERSALVNGNLDCLEHMLPQKEKLIGAINDMQVFGSDELLALQQKVQRNQSLLNSAADGIRAVADRMAELREVRQEFTTYDSTGRRNGFDVRQATKLEKRA